MNIKRLSFLFLCLALTLCVALAFASCGGNGKGNNTPPEDENEDIEGVSFDDATYTYDGEEKTILVSGEIPPGVEVTYSGNVGINAGTYNATATLSGEGYNTLVLNARLTISKASIDLDGIEFGDLTVDYDGGEHKIEIAGELPEGITVSYTGNVGTTPGIYNATATFSGDNYNTKVLNATLTIEKADIDLSGIEFDDLTVGYNGGEHKIEITGELPEGITVSYTGNVGTTPGIYSATATLSGDNYNTKVLNATLTIEKADIDLSGIEFGDLTVDYDGNEHKIEITGELPEGISVSYTGNVGTNPGTYNATATFSGECYNTATLTAILKIEGVIPDVDIEGVTFDNLTVTYNGNEYTIEVTGEVPTGVTVSYLNNVGTNAGTYNATATLSGEGYNNLVLTATLTIEKADITDVSFDDLTVTYNGDEHEIEITGELPEGISVSYSNNIGTNAGTYNAIATLMGDNYNTKVLTATLTIEKANITGITFENKTFKYDGEKKSIYVTGTIPAGFNITYSNNGQTLGGTYVVKATIDGGENYNVLILEATMTISSSGDSGVTTPEHVFG